MNQNIKFIVFVIVIIFSLVILISLLQEQKKCPVCISSKICEACPSCQTCPIYSACENDLPPDLSKGQITMDTGFGKKLFELAKQNDVKMFLELGTWYGAGSSLCIAKGMENPTFKNNKILYTIEIYEPAWLHARKVLRKYPVRCILGGTVPISGYLRPEEMTQEERSNEHYRLYYERDIQLAKYYEPMLEILCKNHDFDAVLIDGNEYTGWAEFVMIRDICDPKYIALHDMGTLKTKKIEHWMNTNKDKWKNIEKGSDRGSEWGIFQKI